MSFSSFLDELANASGTVEDVVDDATETALDGMGVIGKGIILAQKAKKLSDVHDKMTELGEREKKPSALGFAFELGKILVR